VGALVAPKLVTVKPLLHVGLSVVQIYCTHKRTSHVQYNGVQVRGRTHRELYS
jgi:hypothetical protein